MTLWLIEKLNHEFQEIALVSRGYGRKSKGLKKVLEGSPASEVGDEPLLIKKAFPKVQVWVSENRANAVKALESENNRPEIILFDDAFQHLGIEGSFNLILSRFDQPYFKDVLLPAGDLREIPGTGRKPHAVIFTKTPYSIDESTQAKYKAKVEKKFKVPVFFSHQSYGKPKNLKGEELMEFPERIALITGIAFGNDLESYLSSETKVIKHFHYPDHHAFRESDIRDWTQFEESYKDLVWMTTEKDLVRMPKGFLEPRMNRVFFQPVRPGFEKETEEEVLALIRNQINQ